MAVVQDSLYHRLQMMSSALESRPTSALARGVQITEFKETRVNPEPVVLEDSDLLLEQYLSPGKLRLLTGVDNLDDIYRLELKVDTKETSLGNFGSLLPNLTQLKLSNSNIPCIRDLGSSLRNVTVLWMSRCGLYELDGISSMLSLKELYLSYNEICDISALSMLDSLQILDLEGNNIDDTQQIHYLAMCSNLSSLTLEGNPVCVLPTPDSSETEDYDYRWTVKNIIAYLKILDEEALNLEPSPSKKKNVFDDDWAYLEELQRDVGIGGSTESLNSLDSPTETVGRPGTASLRYNRVPPRLCPQTLLRVQTPHSIQETCYYFWGNVRPLTAEKASREESSEDKNITEDASSELTMGTVVCGNPSKALFSRRKINPGSQNTNESTGLKLFPQFLHKPEHTYDPVPDDDKERADIVAELKEWKQHHEKMMEKIKAEKAPQVLVIDHDDAISISGDEEVTDEEDDDDDLPSGLTSLDNSDRPLRENQSGSNGRPVSADRPSSKERSVSSSPLLDLPPPPTPPKVLGNVREPPSGELQEGIIEALKIEGLTADSKKKEEPEEPQETPESLQLKTRLENHALNPHRPCPPIKPLGRFTTQGPVMPRAPPPSAVARNMLSKSMAVPARRTSPNSQDSGTAVIAASASADRPVLQNRPFTARAVLSQVRRQLPQVPTLPSKPSFPK
ncbi:LOW QUALITY PROTEIN: leucine-rich repeat-containing protein 56-like [Crassostrea angulata]|uniref:LOW QUALITY PROTEIN: leucine-rich repeat-containing protein 56-like n=1 Tax=Magallana angulata TaxID=2784310 RepID=UPI0022B0B8E7|nr:LOW QUALITY PROTEIN: leucine-rich repeat-containing protein 56-like [Crassostrea angulata]